MNNKGKLYLIPSPIAENTEGFVATEQLKVVLPQIRFFLAENIRTARRFLSALRIYPSIEDLHFSVLDKDTLPEELAAMFEPVAAGNNIGVISESGCPGIADPGAMAVQFAHSNHIKVVPLVGPSSIILALMSSGLNGQNFAFHGYLPIDKSVCSAAIREYEKESRKKNQTQVFIETPYRNNAVMDLLTKNLSSETRLTVAIDITGRAELIETRRIDEWKRNPLSISKTPAVFLFLA